MSVPLVILAAGLSQRFGRLKQLEPFGPGGETIMDYNAHDAFRAGFDEIVYVLRPDLVERVKAHTDRVLPPHLPRRFAVQDLRRLPEGFAAPPERNRPWGTAHALLCAAGEDSGPLAVCNADDLYGPRAFEELRAFLDDPAAADGAVVGYPLRDTLAGGGGVARGVCHVGKDGWLDQVVEVRQIRRCHGGLVGLQDDDHPVDLTGDELVSMNLWALRPSMIAGIRTRLRRFLERWGAHPGKEFFLSTAVNEQLRGSGARVRVFPAREQWLGVTYDMDAEPFRRQLQERIEAGTYASPLDPVPEED